MHPLVTIAVRAAREAGRVILRDLDRLDALEVSAKGRNDFVSEVDRRAERAIIATIRRSYPDHAVLGEETGAHGEGDHVWVIDPLDGTTNYLHGFPVFSVSIAVKYRGRLEHGVIYDPLRNELFTASHGAGAQLNSRRIRVSKRPGLDGALLGTGFPFRDLGQLDPFLRVFRELLSRTAGIRRAGSAALDLAYVACGRLDGFWEHGLREWDLAAGTLLIQEAGGTVTDFAGGDAFLASGDVVGGGLRVHGAILEVVRRLASPAHGSAQPAHTETGEGVAGPLPEARRAPSRGAAPPAEAATREPGRLGQRPTLTRRRSGRPAEAPNTAEPSGRAMTVTRRRQPASRARPSAAREPSAAPDAAAVPADSTGGGPPHNAFPKKPRAAGRGDRRESRKDPTKPTKARKRPPAPRKPPRT